MIIKSIKEYIRAFLLQLQFLTRIRVPLNVEFSSEDLSRGVIFAPLIGLLIGLISAGVYYLLIRFVHISAVAFVCAVLSEIILTGGLHLDGLADTFDGIFSNRSREKILEIMKDSRIGTNGTLALVFVILIKIFFLLSLKHIIIGCLIAMPVISRMNIAWAAGISSYARKKGMAEGIIRNTGIREIIIATLLTIVICLFLKFEGIIIIIISILFAVLFVKYVEKKIDGITGDIIGAVIELTEIVVLFSFIIIYS